MHASHFSRFALRAQRTAPRAPREYGPPRRGLPEQRTVHRSVHPPCIGQFRGVHEAAHHMRCAGAKRARSLPTFIPERMQWSLSETIMPMTDRGRRLMHDAIAEVIEELMINLPALTSSSSSALHGTHKLTGQCHPATGYRPCALQGNASEHLLQLGRSAIQQPGPLLRLEELLQQLAWERYYYGTRTGHCRRRCCRPGLCDDIFGRGRIQDQADAGALMVRLEEPAANSGQAQHSPHQLSRSPSPATDVSLLRRRTSRPRFIDGLICSSIM